MNKPPSLWIEQSGEGTPVLLISGLGYSSWCWAGVREALKAEYNVVTFDNRGTGRSEKPPAPYSISMMADDAARVLDQCGIKEAHVIGHSMGGYIAQSFTLRHSGRVLSLILVGTSPGGHKTAPVPAETQLSWKVAAILPPADYARTTMPRSFAPGWTEKNPQQFEQYLQQRLQYPTPPANWLAQFNACADFVEHGVQVELITQPTLVIHGQDDCVVPHENGALLAQRLPDARLVILPGVGHLPYLEAPQEFYRIARNFLTEQTK